MTIGQLAMISVSAFFLVTVPCKAGPCSEDISRMRTAIDAKLNALAAAGPSETQGIGPQLHHQPTPHSIADAQTKTGALSPTIIEKVIDAMDRARKADAAGDKAACESALDDAGRLISAK
jgi:hypothetical protein